MRRFLCLLPVLLLGLSALAVACGGGGDDREIEQPAEAETVTGVGTREGSTGEASPADPGSVGEDGGEGAPDPSDGTQAATVGGTYGAGLQAVTDDLDRQLQHMGDHVEGAGSSSVALTTLEAALPRLVTALREAVVGVAALDPPTDLRDEHARLVAGLDEIVTLEEELLARVQAGDAAGALTRANAIAAQQETLEASLSPAMRAAAGPLLGIAGALGFLPLAANDLAPATAAELPAVEAESYLGRLDFPGAERLLTLDPLVVGGVVLITAQWSLPGSTPLGEVLDFYEAALRDLGAEGESQRLESRADAVVTVGREHPFGSAVVTVGAGADGSHLVSVTGSFPSRE